MFLTGTYLLHIFCPRAMNRKNSAPTDSAFRLAGIITILAFVPFMGWYKGETAQELLRFARRGQPPTLTCNTMAAIAVDSNHAQFLLQADVPSGATDLGPTFQVRIPLPGNPWQSCAGGTYCNGAVLPSLSPLPLPDQSIHYSGYATMGQAGGNGVAFGTTTNVRLVTQYSMVGPCVAQASVGVPSGKNYALSIHIPAGHSVTSISTYWRPLGATGNLALPTSNWTNCDNWPISSFTPGQTVVGGACGGNGVQGSWQQVQFGYSTTNEPGDGAEVLGPIGCKDLGSGQPIPHPNNPFGPSYTHVNYDQGCRIRVTYQ